MFKGSVRWSSTYTRNASPKVAELSSRHLTAAPSSTKDSSAAPNHFNVPSSRLSYHWDTLPPTEAQLSHAKHFFDRERPNFLWSASKFHSMAFGDSPEICFLGRSNVGKSSILNALLGAKIAHTSSKKGRTRTMNAYAVGGSEQNSNNRLVVLDMPGYGKGGHSEWGVEILKYLGKRKQLKRAFLLVILSKIDKILAPSNAKRAPSGHEFSHRLDRLDKILQSIKSLLQEDPELDEGHVAGEIIACSSEPGFYGRNLGIGAVRFAMLRAAGLHFQPEVKLAPAVEIVSHEEIFNMQARPNKAGS
ncbi:GTP binding protein [Rutstroemia sp. NJR-2017a WRK4]|nr:GTP binding protein [Rutstroemia sp. NJR-2017a WRK4]